MQASLQYHYLPCKRDQPGHQWVLQLSKQPAPYPQHLLCIIVHAVMLCATICAPADSTIWSKVSMAVPKAWFGLVQWLAFTFPDSKLIQQSKVGAIRQAGRLATPCVHQWCCSPVQPGKIRR